MLKIAKIIPILKSDPNNDIKNYRPISQLSVFSKTFETLIESHLIHYKIFTLNHLLRPCHLERY